MLCPPWHVRWLQGDPVYTKRLPYRAIREGHQAKTVVGNNSRIMMLLVKSHLSLAGQERNSLSGQGSKWDDEGKSREKVVDNLEISRQHFTAFPFCQRHIKAVIKTRPGRHRNLQSSRQEGVRGYEIRRGGQDISDENPALELGDDLLPFGFCQSVANFSWKDVGSEQVVEILAELITQGACLG